MSDNVSWHRGLGYYIIFKFLGNLLVTTDTERFEDFFKGAGVSHYITVAAAGISDKVSEHRHVAKTACRVCRASGLNLEP